MEKKRIMIVDDEPSFTRTTRYLLEQTGDYQVCEVNDSCQAIATGRAFKPDLILLDVVMPQLDGGEVVTKIRADPFLREVPVVFLAALMERDESENGPQERGGYRFLSKLVSREQILDCIETCVA